MFARQPAEAIAVAPADLVADLPGDAARVTFGDGGDVEHRDGRAAGGAAGRCIDAAEIRLRGAHNRENAMAAAAVCLARGLPAEAVAAALRTFAGVPHRMEEIARDRRRPLRQRLQGDERRLRGGGGRLVPRRTVHAILGGRGKGGDYGPLANALAEHGRAVYLIGEAAPRSAEALAAAGIPLHDCGDLERAVAAARAAARPGDVVLLSPAVASYDQYRSFEERGDHFRRLAEGG